MGKWRVVICEFLELWLWRTSTGGAAAQATNSSGTWSDQSVFLLKPPVKVDFWAQTCFSWNWDMHAYSQNTCRFCGLIHQVLELNLQNCGFRIFNKHTIPARFKPGNILRQRLVHTKDKTARQRQRNVFMLSVHWWDQRAAGQTHGPTLQNQLATFCYWIFFQKREDSII